MPFYGHTSEDHWKMQRFVKDISVVIYYGLNASFFSAEHHREPMVSKRAEYGQVFKLSNVPQVWETS